MKGIPQIIMIALHAMAYGIAVNEVAEGKKDGGYLLNKTISTALMMGLLWWGGFFG